MSVTGGPSAPSAANISGMNLQDISPDGSQWLAFKPDLNDENNRGTLWTMPVLGGAARKVSDELINSASFAPDGATIVYAGQNKLGVMDIDGSNAHEIWKSLVDFDDPPRHSPDSKTIRETADNNGKHKDFTFAIWEIGADGKNPRALDFGLKKGMTTTHGMWTPNGKHFVFLGGENFTNTIYESIEPRWFEFWKKLSAVRVSPQKIDVMDMVPSRDSSKM